MPLLKRNIPPLATSLLALLYLLLPWQGSAASSPKNFFKHFHGRHFGKTAENLSKEELTKLFIDEASGSKPNVKDLKKYILLGVDVNTILPDGNTILTRMDDYYTKHQEELALFLIENGADVNYRNKYGETPLHKNTRYLNVCKFLIKKGANINSQDNLNQTPLIIALTKNNFGVCRYLIEKGANPNSRDSFGTTPLEIAMSKKQISLAMVLINSGADVNAEIPGRCVTPLVWAANWNSCKLVKFLLKKGAKTDVHGTGCHNEFQKWDYTHLNEAGDNGIPPLSFAAFYNSLDMAKMLIDYGANVNITDSFGRTPLMVAAHEKSNKVAALLIKNGAKLNIQGMSGMTALSEAINYKSSKIARLLIENGADINIKDSSGETPLMLEVWANNHLTKLFLERGADINLRSKSGSTAIQFATSNYQASKLLIEHGADVNGSGNECYPILIAARYSRIYSKIVRLLVEHGANVNVTSCDSELTRAFSNYSYYPANQYTPLHTAVAYGYPKLVRFLINHGAKVNAANRYGITPLKEAVISGKKRTKIVEILLKNNAATDLPLDTTLLLKEIHYPLYPFYPENEDLSPLGFALRKNRKGAVRNLLKYGANVNYRTRGGLTPLMVAGTSHRGKNLDIVKLLIKNGAEINTTDSAGKSPLFYANYHGNVKVAKLLVEKGADLKVINKEGENLLFH